MEKILLVEDDESLGPSLLKYLTNEGHDVDLSTSLEDGRAKLDSTKYQLIILDWMLGDGQGVDLLKELRRSGKVIPIIMLTARADLIDKVIGLESGANDYMTKPFEPRELMARVRVQLRDKNVAIKDNKMISLKGIDFNFEKREVRYNNALIELTKMEYELLKLLLLSPGKAFSREEILNKVWGYEHYPTTRTVDTHILQLRQKFWDQMIETIRGVGYRFNE